ncbi:hypothetical protein ATHL_02164 [Anaerolinea thermolimosa]|uniref:hypothetical protein n=1 Tax=Anaerolinea thermolimosa TaxID=229919 RepID=UPI000784FC89|nr:hypothetical protein [Anaerolinea thermolimosa]GAP07293.1 hypothetical protein ATHL_02164 [Anaerolinea thermolimosa]
MIRGLLRELLSSPLYRDFRFQLRLVTMAGGLFLFVFPSLVGMSLFYVDLLTRRPEWQGNRLQLSGLEAFAPLLGDTVTRGVVLGLIFLLGLVCMLSAAHDEPRLSPVLDALGLVLVVYSLFFLTTASDRCIPSVGCSREFFFTAVVLAYVFGLAGVWIPRISRRLTAWLALPYLSVLLYQSFLWLVTLARTPWISLDWPVVHAVLLFTATMILPVLVAWIGLAGKPG